MYAKSTYFLIFKNREIQNFKILNQMQPDLIKENILLKTQRNDILNLCQTDVNWRNFCSRNDNASLWKSLIQRDNLVLNLPDLKSYNTTYGKKYSSWFDLYKDGNFLIRKAIIANGFTGAGILNDNSVYFWGLDVQQGESRSNYKFDSPIINLGKGDKAVIMLRNNQQYIIRDSIPTLFGVSEREKAGRETNKLIVDFYYTGNLETVLYSDGTAHITGAYLFGPDALPNYLNLDVSLLPNKIIKIQNNENFVLALLNDSRLLIWGNYEETQYTGDEIMRNVIDFCTSPNDHNTFTVLTTIGTVVYHNLTSFQSTLGYRYIQVTKNQEDLILLRNDNNIEIRNYANPNEVIDVFNFSPDFEHPIPILKIDSSATWSLLLMENGEVHTWSIGGENEFGQAPGLVTPPNGKRFVVR